MANMWALTEVPNANGRLTSMNSLAIKCVTMAKCKNTTMSSNGSGSFFRQMTFHLMYNTLPLRASGYGLKAF